MSVTLHVTESNTVVSPVDSNVTLEVSSNTATLELADTLSYSSMTAGDILASIKTVDGTGSGLDADTVDGSHASAFEPSLGNPSVDGYVLSSTATGTRSWVSNAGGGGASDVSELTTSTGSNTNMVRVAASGGLEYRTTAQVLSDIGAAASSHTHTESEITDLGDYAVSGHAHDYAASSHTHVEADITDLGSYLTTVAINDVSDITITTPADNEVLAYNSGTSTWINQTAAEAGLAASSHTHTESDITDLGSYATTTALSNHEADTTSIHGIADTSALVTTSDYTAADVLTKVKTVDGTGSGLDADLLDGNEATAFAAASHTHTESEITDLGSYEPALGNPGTDGYVLSSTVAGTRSWVANSGSGASDVDDLTTTTGSSTNMVRVAAGGGLEYRTTAQVLSDIGAAASSHTHTESEITDLGSYLTTVAINDVSDITITTPADNEVLAYNSGTSTWVNQTASEAGLAAASHNHATTDITSGTFADARIAASNVTQHQAALSITESQISDLGSYLTSVALDGVSDVTITAPSDNEVLAYNSGTSTWINQTASEAGLAAASHSHATTDITSGTFADARIAASNVTQHQAALSITESQISDLGTYLTTVALNDISDVTLSTLADNNLLAYNSGTSTWTNQTAASAGVAALSHTHQASDINSGTFVDNRIAESNVTQHQGAIDHGSIAGLSDDDHTQYALLAGRSGGTTLYGGTAAADDFTIDSTSNATKGDLVLQPSGGNVGIGTSSPGANVHIVSSGNAVFKAESTSTTNAARIDYSTNGDDWITGARGSGMTPGDCYYIYNSTDGQYRFLIDSSGNVGIGTTSPTAPLHIYNTQNFGFLVERSDSGNAAIMFANATTGNTTSDGYVVGIDSSENAYVYNKENTDLYFGTNNAEIMRIKAAGAVGIGTSSPTAKLQVNGSFAIVDGMTAPSTISGYAVIYVDSADGDLKVKFGDGTVKTIVTDT